MRAALPRRRERTSRGERRESGWTVSLSSPGDPQGSRLQAWSWPEALAVGHAMWRRTGGGEKQHLSYVRCHAGALRDGAWETEAPTQLSGCEDPAEKGKVAPDKHRWTQPPAHSGLPSPYCITLSAGVTAQWAKSRDVHFWPCKSHICCHEGQHLSF